MMTSADPPGAVVDTDVISYLFKSDTRAELYRPHLSGKLLVVSFMTIAELDRWALDKNWGEALRSRMEQQLRNFIIHQFDRALCTRWAEVVVSAKRNGYKIQTADAWVAATALHHRIPLVTNNANDYRGVNGLQIISER
jgi:tRNA(fMet)-specific endonuclease VapC